jgi:hypothetical protein
MLSRAYAVKRITGERTTWMRLTEELDGTLQIHTDIAARLTDSRYFFPSLRARILIRMGVPTKPNASRIWFSRKR